MKISGKVLLEKGKRLAVRGDRFSKWDWALFIALAGFCFLSFAHGDIYLTGNRGWMLYESNFFNYYDVLENWTGDHGANYMPTTFWLFAIWILPLKLLGVTAPASVFTNSLVCVLWYKGLTTVFYMASAYLIYRIALQLGLNQRRSKIAMFSFITMPVAFYSQFIFSQYDIFTVFFMLLGMYFYFRDSNGQRSRKDHILFCLSFGVALTCKYYALLIFAIFILVEEKRVSRLLLSLLTMALPFAAEYLLYAGSQGFQNGVFGFGALDYISQADIVTKIGSASFVKIFCVIIVIWAYFSTPKDREDKIRWVLYLCCGIGFALFGLMTFHPQWLLFAVPFWVLSAMISKHTEKFYWCNTVFIAVFYLFVFQYWRGSLDDVSMGTGIWKYWFSDRPMHLHTIDVIPSLDHNTLYAVIIAVLLAYFVFAHPNYTRKKLSDDDGRDHMWLLRMQLIAAVVVFAIPCFYAASYDAAREYITMGENQTQIAAVVSDSRIVQEIGDMNGELDSVEFFVYTYARSNTADVYLQITEKSTGNVLFKENVDCTGTADGNWRRVPIDNVFLSDSQNYLIEIGSTNGTSENCYAIALGENHDSFTGFVNGVQENLDVALRLGFLKD